MRHLSLFLSILAGLGLATGLGQPLIAQTETDLTVTGIIRMDQDPEHRFTLITVTAPQSTSVDAVFRLQQDEQRPALPTHDGPGRLLCTTSRLTLTFEDGQRYLIRVAGLDVPLPSLEGNTSVYDVVGIARFKLASEGLTREDLVTELLAPQVGPLVGQCSNCWSGGEGATACSQNCTWLGSCSVNCQPPNYYACCGCRPGPYCVCCHTP
jgi:hypothetical protein